MGCLDRYIAWRLLQGWILVWLVMSAIFGLLTFIEELDRVTEHYQTLDALHFVLYTLPQRSMELAPVIILLGSMLALAGLNKNSEIIAIRAAGVSLLRFFRSVAIPAIALVLHCMLPVNLLQPPSTRRLKSAKYLFAATRQTC